MSDDLLCCWYVHSIKSGCVDQVYLKCSFESIFVWKKLCISKGEIGSEREVLNGKVVVKLIINHLKQKQRIIINVYTLAIVY
ncbi:hypothetical protein GCM10008022_13060 [Paenibacillus hunanensis]|nr:hypothetical protein GCM10008022_13060 [Paenibacillus hunanensis]